MTKYMLDILADTSQINNSFDLLDSFQISANILYAIAHDEKAKSRLGNADFSNHYLIISLYLFRHSIELGIKALVESITTEDLRGHNIETLWNRIPKIYKLFLSKNKQVDKAFDVLKTYQILIDEQLFRYHIDKNKNALKDLPEISNPEYEELLGFVNSIQQACRCCSHIRKNGPLDRDPWLPYLKEYDLFLMQQPPSEVKQFTSIITQNGLFEINDSATSYVCLLTDIELKELGFGGYLKKAKIPPERSIKHELNHEMLKKLLKKIIEKDGYTLFYI